MCAASSDLTPDELEKVQAAFNRLDVDGCGTITTNDLSKIFFSLGIKVEERKIKTMIAAADLNQDGVIDFNEFVQLIKPIMPKDANISDEIMKAFRVFDRNGDGYVTAEELRIALLNLGEKLTEEEAERFIEDADIDGDGRINYEEFVAFMTKED